MKIQISYGTEMLQKISVYIKNMTLSIKNIWFKSDPKLRNTKQIKIQ